MYNNFPVDNLMQISGTIGFVLGVFLGAKRKRPPVGALVVAFVAPVLLCAVMAAVHFSKAGDGKIIVALNILANSSLTGAAFVTSLSLALLMWILLSSIVSLFPRHKAD
jgi:hypothetical protein